MTLAQVRDNLSTLDDLKISERSAMVSAINRFADIARMSPSQIVADPCVIRDLKVNANWQLAGRKKRDNPLDDVGISKESWANIVSLVTKAMKLAGIAVDRRRRNFKPSVVWTPLLDKLTQNDRHALNRFAGWCTTHQISPEAVSQDTFVGYLNFLLSQSIQKNPKERWHCARRAWNRLANDAHTLLPVIEDVAEKPWRGRPWSDFPESLQEEVKRYCNFMLGDDFADRDSDIFDDRFWRKTIKPVTLKGYLNNLRWYASRQIDRGVPVENFTSLATVIEPIALAEYIKPKIDSAGGDEKVLIKLQTMMIAVLSVARYLQVSPEVARRLKTIFRKVRHRPDRPGERTRTRLNQFKSGVALSALINLPFQVAERLPKQGAPTVAEARDMQLACAVVVLLFLNFRIKNVVGLCLDKHIQRPIGGRTGPWRFEVGANEVKNGQTLSGYLTHEASMLLERYVNEFRPLLLKQQTTALFVSQTGKRKCAAALSKQVRRFVKRETGLDVHSHLFRSLAGELYLRQNPGDYETVRQMLGHKNVETTRRHYSGHDAERNLTRYSDIIEDLRQTDKFSEEDFL
jgi:integrase